MITVAGNIHAHAVCKYIYLYIDTSQAIAKKNMYVGVDFDCRIFLLTARIQKEV